MRYYGAREMADENGKGLGTFRFTVMQDRSIRTHGACRDGCRGHATPAEACDHIKDGETGHLVLVPVGDEYPHYKCEAPGCKARATLRAGPAFLILAQPFLCGEHATREHVREMWGRGVEFTAMAS